MPATSPCSVASCARVADGGRGWCNLHYLRWRQHGDPEVTLLDRHATPAERLERRSDRSGGSEACWPWLGETDKDGYGQLAIRGKRHRAHRLSYETHVGPITDETIDHSCNNPPCINPRHLRPMSRVDNTMRGAAQGAINAAKTHCDHGHPFDAENTYILPSTGERVCRECSRARKRAYRARCAAAGGGSSGGGAPQ